MGEVCENLKGIFEMLFIVVWEVNLVDGFIQPSMGIEVVTKGHTNGLEVFNEFIFWEMSRALECHMFEEVGEALLSFGLHEGTSVYEEAEADSIFRCVIVFDNITQAVIQGAKSNGGIYR